MSEGRILFRNRADDNVFPMVTAISWVAKRDAHHRNAFTLDFAARGLDQMHITERFPKMVDALG
ncbi:MAG: hypothetical protein KDN19_07455 [Verrucomicrobiae bacterium]|nr:hypothetical protein [Verrucomicrobiae bacterium]